jgi:hypothetical protein
VVCYYPVYLSGTVPGASVESNSKEASGGRIKGVEYPDDNSDRLFPVFIISYDIPGHSTLYTAPYGK